MMKNHEHLVRQTDGNVFSSGSPCLIRTFRRKKCNGAADSRKSKERFCYGVVDSVEKKTVMEAYSYVCKDPENNLTKILDVLESLRCLRLRDKTGGNLPKGYGR